MYVHLQAHTHTKKYFVIFIYLLNIFYYYSELCIFFGGALLFGGFGVFWEVTGDYKHSKYMINSC